MSTPIPPTTELYIKQRHSYFQEIPGLIFGWVYFREITVGHIAATLSPLGRHCHLFRTRFDFRPKQVTLAQKHHFAAQNEKLCNCILKQAHTRTSGGHRRWQVKIVS